MAILTNGVETIEIGSKVWRITCNTNFEKLDQLIGNVNNKADIDLGNVSNTDFKVKTDAIGVAYQTDLDVKANNDLSNITNTSITEDIIFADEAKGIVLIDRADTAIKYRVYIENGSLNIEQI